MSYRPRYEEVPNEERVRIMLEDVRPRWNHPGNDSVITHHLGEGVQTRETILKTIDRLGDAKAIIYAPGVSEALAAAKEKHPLNSFEAFGHEKRVLDKCEEIGWSIQSVGNLADVMDWLIENEPPIPLTAAGREAQQQLRNVETRTNQINEITNGYKSGFKLRSPSGAYHSTRTFDKDGFEIEFSSSGGGRTKPKGGGFDAMTDDEVSAIHAEVMEERRLRGLSKEELKAEINPQRQKAYEASSRSMQPNPLGVELINPDDGTVINTKRDLIRFINSGRDNTKRLLQRRGETDKTLARRFEEILNS